MAYRFLEPGEISIHDDRWMTYPWGVTGGEPGQRSDKILHRADGTVENMPSKCDRIKVEANDMLFFNTWGGGGCGDPFEREPEKVAFDVKAGLVSVKGAKRYGVVLKDDLTVNEKRTATLRAKLSKARGKPAVFNFGGTIEEIKKRCKKETGFDAPRPPEFQSWVTQGEKVTKAPAKKKRKKRATKPKAA